MGTRINFYFKNGNSDDKECQVCTILYSNNSHPDIDAIKCVKELLTEVTGSTEIVRRLLNMRYLTDGGNHTKDDYIFSVNYYPLDREKDVEITARDTDLMFYDQGTPALSISVRDIA